MDLKYFKLSLTLLLLFAIQRGNAQNDKKPIDYVNPFIGTDFFGNVFPGASLPYALVHVSPDTHNAGWLYRKGYVYTDDNIVGFSHSHGAGSGGEILLMPTVHQKIQVVPGEKENPDTGYRSRFSHKQEKASAGYYQVKLLDYDVNVELTTTPRVAFHRYTFPESEFSRVILDLGYTIRGGNGDGNCVLNIVNDTTIEGHRKSVNSSGNIYFVAHFSKPFEYYGTFDTRYKSPESNAGFYPMKSGEKGDKIGAFVQYGTKEDEQILVKVAVSYVSLQGARKNLTAEIPHWNFDKTHEDAEKIWDKELNRIQVEGDSEQDKIKFYTAMYRTLLSQYIFQDVDGNYLGMGGKIQMANDYNFYSTIFTWDTYRTAHPLLTLAAPGQVNDIMKSIEAKIRESGWVPGLHSYNKFSDGMIGDHMIPIVVDAFMKGFRDFDAEYVYQAMKKKAMELPSPPVPLSAARDGLKEYLNLGYVPADKNKESVSSTLEFAYDDWCLAQMAKEMGKTNDYKYFMKRAGNYANLWDTETEFMRPKLANGHFLERLTDKDKLLEIKSEGNHSWYAYFEPLLIGRSPNRHYTESNAWPYIWAVQHDISGLINLFGSQDKFNAKLDSLFTMSPSEMGYKYVGTVGTIGQYVQGNQPSHHVAYLYNFSGLPWKTQYYTRYICERLYKAGPGGLSGNDDMGSMSSWYNFSSMGFYPVTPGSNMYIIGSPVFDRVQIKLEKGKTFSIEAKNNSKTNIYIQSVKINGKAINRTWISHNEIMKGGVLEFEMGPEPNKSWGTKPEDAPGVNSEINLRGY